VRDLVIVLPFMKAETRVAPFQLPTTRTRHRLLRPDESVQIHHRGFCNKRVLIPNFSFHKKSERKKALYVLHSTIPSNNIRKLHRFSHFLLFLISWRGNRSTRSDPSIRVFLFFLSRF
jgi:hypothetical protein